MIPSAARRPVHRPPPPRSRPLREAISTVLVTGASGALGTFLVQHLLRQKLNVVAVDREAEPFPVASRETVTIRRGTLLDPAFLGSCMEGVDAVIHTAGHVGGRPPSVLEHRALTVEQTRVLYSASQRRGVKRFLLTGSASVYRRTSAPITEREDLDPAGEQAQDHIEAEKIVLWDSSPGLPRVTVLRPGPIYGPGCAGGLASIAALPPLVRSLGPLYLPFSGGPTLSLVHVEDAARAAVFLLLHPGASREVFNLGDKKPMALGTYINLAMECYGLEPLGPGVPYPPGTLLQSILPYLDNDEIFNPLSRVGTLLWERMIRKKRLTAALSPRIDPKTIAPGARDLLLDCSKLMGLGFNLKYPSFGKGWEKTVAWYVNRAWIPKPELF